MDDAREPAVRGRFDELTCIDRRRVQAAPEPMRIVARQQHDFAGAHFDSRGVSGLHQAASFDDVVIRDHVRRPRQVRAAIRGVDPRHHAPRCGQLDVEEDTAGQLHVAEQVEERVHGSGAVERGGSDNYSGVPVRFPSAPFS